MDVFFFKHSGVFLFISMSSSGHVKKGREKKGGGVITDNSYFDFNIFASHDSPAI